jgi:4-alpha-glucanotransferase
VPWTTPAVPACGIFNSPQAKLQEVPLEDAVREAAENLRIQQEFWDIFGHSHQTATETNRAILTALGIDCSTEESIRACLARRAQAEWSRCLRPVLVSSVNSPIRIPLRMHANAHQVQLEIVTEENERHSFQFDLADLPLEQEYRHGGEHIVERSATLPVSLPLGYHDVRCGESSMRLIITPDRAHMPEPGKHAGFGAMMWAIRSHRDWGCGDFTALRELVNWAAGALHADFLALSPLHATKNRRPYNSSPYLPQTIFFRNFIYLDVTAVPGYELIRPAFETPERVAEIERLRVTPTVEYEQVAALKREALNRIFDANSPSPECRQWIEKQCDLLRSWCTYCALDEHLHAADPAVWVWPDWPEPYRDPASPAVARFADAHEREILFHGWLQWLIDGQLEAAQRSARDAGMSIGLYHDLALATDRCGGDLWAHRDFYVAGNRVGAPPDDFSPNGQDWSFPPPNRDCHLADGYRLYSESIRHTLRHGGALRIDHVMRLFRLYWIPEGHDAAHGAYVRDNAEDLIRILALESVRNRAVVIGEDLGTVEDSVRDMLARFGVLSYRLLYFERDQARFKRPGEYPEQALASTSTHDLPTIAGFWTANDVEARRRTGAIDEKDYQRQKDDRARDKQHLLDTFFALHLLPEGHERSAERIPELTPDLHQAIVGFLATTTSSLWLINQEDMTKEPEQQNLPGTTSEYPNWSRRMRWAVEDLQLPGEARDCAAMVRHWVERSGRERS